VTKADIRKAAAATFTPANRTVAKIETVSPSEAKR
jgi:hypothetical protein